MIIVPEITIERIAVVEGHGEPLRDLALKAARSAVQPSPAPSSSPSPAPSDIGGVIVATFSNERRFPALAVEIASALGLTPSVPAFDLQLACSAYPYALYLAGRMATDTGRKVLIVDGDVQSRLVDKNDHDTGSIFSDAVTATIVGVNGSSSRADDSRSRFDFYSRFDETALSCGESGPIRMKGFDVFSFVATDILKFLKNFISSPSPSPSTPDFDYFVPHQANPYMVRQLAKSLGLSGRLLTLDESKKNPGSCSIPMTLAAHPECRGKRVLLAGFGAGYSAAAAVVRAVVAFALSAFASFFAFAGGMLDVRLDARDLTPLKPDAAWTLRDCAVPLVTAEGAALPIVHADERRATAAAEYLVSVLTEMTGVEVERYLLPDGATNAFAKSVFIPRPESGDAFGVEAGLSGVRFSGRSDFAVYDFCERVLGVRHYWDGPGGRSVPKRREVVLPFLGYSDSPVFSFREFYGRGDTPWGRVAKGGGTFDRAARCHSTDDGFCYGSPEGLAEYCRRVDADIAGGEKFGRVVDRRRKTVSVSPWDVAYDCRCRWCRTLKGHLRERHGEATPIVWERFLPGLVKHLAARHPDYRVSVLAYWNYVDAPRVPVDIGTNVQAEVCSMSGLAAFKDEGIRACEEGMIRDWVRVTGRKIANWHYSCWPAEYTPAPYVYGHTIADHYRRTRELSVGSFICGGKDDFPRFALSLYVWMRCLWNPDIDVDAVYDEFCVRQFGPAAKPMREMIRIQEEDWNPRTLMFPQSSLIRLSELMTEAAELVRGTSAASAFLYYNRGFSGVFERR